MCVGVYTSVHCLLVCILHTHTHTYTHTHTHTHTHVRERARAHTHKPGAGVATLRTQIQPWPTVPEPPSSRRHRRRCGHAAPTWVDLMGRRLESCGVGRASKERMGKELVDKVIGLLKAVRAVLRVSNRGRSGKRSTHDPETAVAAASDCTRDQAVRLSRMAVSGHGVCVAGMAA